VLCPNGTYLSFKVENIVIPAQAGIRNVLQSSNLDSGSPLRSTQNDGIFGSSKRHSDLIPVFEGTAIS